VHEEAERRALDGELAKLAEEWKEAEEVAAIADDLFVTPSVDEWVKQRSTEMRAPASGDA
jgi:hypothetical protein